MSIKRKCGAKSFILGACTMAIVFWLLQKQDSIKIEYTDNWKDVKVNYKFEDYQLKDGKVFFDLSEKLYMESKSGWSFNLNENSYVLFDVYPGDIELLKYRDESMQGLYIALVNDENTQISKNCLASGVKDISEVKTKGDSLYVSGVLADGCKTNILISLPEKPKPLPDIRVNAKKYLDAYESYLYAMSSSDDRPNHYNDALDESYKNSNIYRLLEDEKVRFLDVYYDMFGVEEGLTNATQKLELIGMVGNQQADLINEENEAENFDIPTSRKNIQMWEIQEARDYVWDNLIKAVNMPENWRKIRNLKGIFRGFSFEAKDGIAIFKGKVKYSHINSEREQILILRLMIDEVREEWCFNPVDFSNYDEEKIKFELILAGALSGSYLPETGYFVCRDGVWVEDSLDGVVENPYEKMELLEPFKWEKP